MLDRYEPAAFEAKWRERWQSANLFKTREDDDRPKFYGLDFFPYPSGAGLSVGHCRNYIPTDVLCRLKVMQGFNVLHPMGFDAFGLPAENEAIKNKRKPGPMVEQYGETYHRQLDLVGISYDWSRSFYSCDPRYYKWTQWIFELLYKKGLAYQRMAAVNWDPVDKTVLADEEIIGGRAERSGAIVEKRYLPQWYFKITEYAQRLLDDLDDIDWPEGIKQQQRNWIGKSEGVQFLLEIANSSPSEAPHEGFEVISHKTLSFEVFTTRIDTLFGVTFCVFAPEHPLVNKLLERASDQVQNSVREYLDRASRLTDADRTATTREKTGVFSGAYAINPATGESIPIWIADYVLATYGTGAIMAVPGHDDRDYEFAQKFGLPVKAVIAPQDSTQQTQELPFVSKDGVLINSGEYSNLTVAEAQKQLGEWIEALGIGQRKVQYKLRDWLISRQRYWGCPIPIIHSAEGEIQPVPQDCLPVMLPDVESYEPSGDGSSPLSRIDEFVNVTDLDGKLGKRETDTMGGFACSSWYFLRFADPQNDDQPFSPEKVKYWLPVDVYVGGAEHAVMHLLYARFWTKVLYDEGLVPVKEPFQRLYNQGQVLANTPFRKPREGENLPVGEDGVLISFKDAKELPADDVFYRWARMSKSKGNVVTPEEAVDSYGADALRVYELFVAPFEADIRWSNEGIQGAIRFLNRICKFASEVVPVFNPQWRSQLEFADLPDTAQNARRSLHKAIKKATADIERFAFNTYISSLMEYLNDLTSFQKSVDLEALTSEESAVLSEAAETLCLLISPAAPHTADEIWEGLGKGDFTYNEPWPQYKEELTKDSVVTIAIQVNGKLRDTLEVAASVSQEELIHMALASSKVQAHVQGKTIKKQIVVPGKLVNIVAP